MSAKSTPAGRITKLMTERRLTSGELTIMVTRASHMTAAQVAVEGVPAAVIAGVVTKSGIVRDDRKRARWISHHSGIPYSTVQKRLKEQANFQPTEADRIMTSFRITDLATSLFNGNREEAIRWLDQPHRLLNGDTPIERAQTSVGAAQVEKLIHRIEHGNAA